MATLDIAVIGMGPRGLSVLERLLVRLSDKPLEAFIRIWAIDPGEPGAGRIWRTKQPPSFVMNTAAGEVTLYSGGSDGGPHRAGAGPSFAEWLREHPDPQMAALGPDDYAPRAVYGEYLRSVYENLIAYSPRNVAVYPVSARAEQIKRYGNKRMVVCDRGGYSLIVDKVLLTTGHPRNHPDATERKFMEFSDSHPGLRHLRGDSTAEMPLDTIQPDAHVGIIGLGLTFFDIVAALTEGRGGKFVEDNGRLRYEATGREPQIIAGSRSGLIMLARGRNQKPPEYRYKPVFVTHAAIADARRRAQRQCGSVQLDFMRDVFPLIMLEVEHVYYKALARRRYGDRTAQEFAHRHRRYAELNSGHEAQEAVQEFRLDDVPKIELERMARPFADEYFQDPAAFQDRISALMTDDVAEAEQGNLDGPLKAALDVLRDLRGTLREAVEFGSLTPTAHREDFIGWFQPIYALVAVGPPPVRLSQACALIESGILTIVGPDMQVSADERLGRFVLHSPQVGGSRREVTVLIDGRVPRPQVHRDADPLIRQLLVDGLISEHTNVEPLTGEVFRAGSLAVTKPPFRVVDAQNRPDPHMYALGVPTENTRWFNMIANGRPGPLAVLHSDADAVAADMLRVLSAASEPVPAVSEESTKSPELVSASAH